MEDLVEEHNNVAMSLLYMYAEFVEFNYEAMIHDCRDQVLYVYEENSDFIIEYCPDHYEISPVLEKRTRKEMINWYGSFCALKKWKMIIPEPFHQKTFY